DTVAVRIRLKRIGRRHRACYRICVMDIREPRDGKAIEEVGTYDPMIRDTDSRVTMQGDRIDYWISKGAVPSDMVARLIEKYKGKVPTMRVDKPKDRPTFVRPTSAEQQQRRTAARPKPVENVTQDAAVMPDEPEPTPTPAPALTPAP
ncbi:MAG: 30S ribosomal protein S16, partial [Planctomycetia bacterium]